jgi:16S rRNA (guanine527-N7)-methyltransferase
MYLAKSKYTSELSDEAVAAALRNFGISSTPRLAHQIRLYVDLLLVWNQALSLTAIRQPKEILYRHFGESMFAVHAVPIRAGCLVDVGAGAGFPGLAVKLLVPELKLVIIESNRRKVAFLKEVARRLDLESVEVMAERFERIELPAASAEYITARAVGNISRLMAWADSALGTGGKLILWLGRANARELVRVEGWDWRASILIPHSRQRVLLVGLRKRAERSLFSPQEKQTTS